MAPEQKKPKKKKNKKAKAAEALAQAQLEEAPKDGELKELVIFRAEVPDPKMGAATAEAVDVLLRRLRSGERLFMPQSRYMSDIGARCHELRVSGDNGIWRIFYRADPDAIIVVYVLWKTTQNTPQAVMDLCENRFKQYDALVASMP